MVNWAATAAAFYACAALLLGRQRLRPTRAVLAALAAGIAVAVAGSRVLLDVHWLSDVIAGLALGWASREMTHAQEKAGLESRTINRADIKIQDFTFDGTPRGQIGVYLDGNTAGTRNFVTGFEAQSPSSG